MSITASSGRRWEHFAHMADMGVRGVGPSREAAFEEAALALCAAMTDPELVRRDILFEVDCNAQENEFLLVDWLNALISKCPLVAEYSASSRFTLITAICMDEHGAKLPILCGTIRPLR